MMVDSVCTVVTDVRCSKIRDLDVCYVGFCYFRLVLTSVCDGPGGGGGCMPEKPRLGSKNGYRKLLAPLSVVT